MNVKSITISRCLALSLLLVANSACTKLTSSMTDKNQVSILSDKLSHNQDSNGQDSTETDANQTTTQKDQNSDPKNTMVDVQNSTDTKTDPKADADKKLQDEVRKSLAKQIDHPVNQTNNDNNKIVEIPDIFSDNLEDASKNNSNSGSDVDIKQSSTNTPITSNKETPAGNQQTTANSEKQETAKQQNSAASLYLKIIKTDFLEALIKNPNLVLYRSKLVDATAAMNDLKTADEDGFCTVKSITNPTKDTTYEVTDANSSQLDTENDIYQTTLIFIDSNKNKLEIICTHTTSTYYPPQLMTNFSGEIQVYSKTNSYSDYKSFVHPKAEERKLKSIKIINLAALDELAHSDQNKSLLNGKVVDTEAVAAKALINGTATSFCMASGRSEKLDITKDYLFIAAKIRRNDDKDVFLADAIFISDENNYFVFNCWMNKKTAHWEDLFTVASGIFKFGTLNRVNYNKELNRLKPIYNEIMR